MLIGFKQVTYQEAVIHIPEQDNLQIAELFPWGYATGTSTRNSFLNQLKTGRILAPNDYWRSKGYGPGFVDEDGRVFLLRFAD